MRLNFNKPLHKRRYDEQNSLRFTVTFVSLGFGILFGTAITLLLAAGGGGCRRGMEKNFPAGFRFSRLHLSMMEK